MTLYAFSSKALILRFRMAWSQTRDNVCSRMKRISLCSAATRSVTASWSVIWRGPLGSRAAFPGISPVTRTPSWPLVIHGRQLSSRRKLARLTRQGPLTKGGSYTYRVIHNIRPKKMAYCSQNMSLRDFQSLLGAHQMWSI